LWRNLSIKFRVGAHNCVDVDQSDSSLSSCSYCCSIFVGVGAVEAPEGWFNGSGVNFNGSGDCIILMDHVHHCLLIAVRSLFQTSGLIKADPSEHAILIRQKRAQLTAIARVVECDDENGIIFLRRGIAVTPSLLNEVGVETAPMMRVFPSIIARKLDAGL
jgi:hypothetical protein